jgi:hypothetical protein
LTRDLLIAALGLLLGIGVTLSTIALLAHRRPRAQPRPIERRAIREPGSDVVRIVAVQPQPRGKQ